MRIAILKRKILNAGAIWMSYIKLIPDMVKLGKNSLIIDCGANIGHISNLLARTGATIIAFEPDPTAYKILLQKCQHKTNITLIQKGVWDKNATLDLYTHKATISNEKDFTVSSSIIIDKININAATGQLIEVIDLIAFMQKLNQKIDLVKLDVEGAEIEILNKIIATESWNLFDRMYVETHETKIPSQVKDLKNIKALLKKKGIKNIKLNWI